MLLQIHDELVFEAPETELPRLAELVGRVMTSALDLKVPLKVDIAAGPNWLDVEPIVATAELSIIGRRSPNKYRWRSRVSRAESPVFCTNGRRPIAGRVPYRIKFITIDTDPLQDAITLHHACPPLPRFLRCFEKPWMSDDGWDTFRKPTWFNQFTTLRESRFAPPATSFGPRVTHRHLPR